MVKIKEGTVMITNILLFVAAAGILALIVMGAVEHDELQADET